MGLNQLAKQAVLHSLTSQPARDLATLEELPRRQVMEATEHSKTIDKQVNQTKLFLVVFVEHNTQSARRDIGGLPTRTLVQIPQPNGVSQQLIKKQQGRGRIRAGYIASGIAGGNMHVMFLL